VSVIGHAVSLEPLRAVPGKRHPADEPGGNRVAADRQGQRRGRLLKLRAARRTRASSGS
jgi:hypothetical protein